MLGPLHLLSSLLRFIPTVIILLMAKYFSPGYSNYTWLPLHPLLLPAYSFTHCGLSDFYKSFCISSCHSPLGDRKTLLGLITVSLFAQLWLLFSLL